MRHPSAFDRLLEQADQALRTLCAPPAGERPNPADGVRDAGPMNADQRAHAAGLMRVNHTGEVCAQALYYGQSLVAREGAVRRQLLQAAREEGDHLAWCAERLGELDDRPSRLNPWWYAGAFSLGAGAALLGDRASLGFVGETERQVEAHLHDHLERLPPGDERSRAIVRQMAAEEAQHGARAMEAGGEALPEGIQQAMGMAAGFMKLLAYRW